MKPDEMVREVQRHFLQHDHPGCRRNCHIEGAREALEELRAGLLREGYASWRVDALLQPYFDALDGAA